MMMNAQDDTLFPQEHLEEVVEDDEASLDLSIEEDSLDFSVEGEEAEGEGAAVQTKVQTRKRDQLEEEGITSEVEGKAKPKRKRWYIIHTYSGHENKVKINLERRIESMGMQEKIFRVEVPQKPVTKIKEGKRVEKDENVFPSYVLIEMIMDDDSWYCVRYTPGVTKFVGGEKKPVPARDAEIKKILMRGQTTKKKVEIDLKAGDHILVISGPFADFNGTVTEVQAEKEKLKATISIFGRETPVELTFSQIQKQVK